MVDVPDADVETKGRLMPGNIFLVDFEARRVVRDQEARAPPRAPATGTRRRAFRWAQLGDGEVYVGQRRECECAAAVLRSAGGLEAGQRAGSCMSAARGWRSEAAPVRRGRSAPRAWRRALERGAGKWASSHAVPSLTRARLHTCAHH